MRKTSVIERLDAQAVRPGLERLRFANRSGASLAGLVAWPGGAVRGVAVLPPAFQLRMVHHSVLSAYLTAHGVATVRFDLTNHPGLSDGDVRELTMSSIASDIAAAMNASESLGFSGHETVLVAPSLSGRGAIRVASERQNLAGLLLLLPAVDLRATVAAVVGRDYFAAWEAGIIRDATVVGQVYQSEVSASFVCDAIQGDWLAADTVAGEVKAVRAPVVAIAASHDELVRPEAVTAALGRRSPWARSTQIIDGGCHDLVHDVFKMREVLDHCVSSVLEMVGSGQTPVHHLSLEEITTVMDAERHLARDAYRALPSCELPVR